MAQKPLGMKTLDAIALKIMLFLILIVYMLLDLILPYILPYLLPDRYQRIQYENLTFQGWILFSIELPPEIKKKFTLMGYFVLLGILMGISRVVMEAIVR